MQEITHTLRQMPGYQARLAAGKDVGLAIALQTITKEAARQHDLAAIANATMPAGDAYRVAFKHQYALARLSHVATVVAVYLRQVPA